MDKTDIGKTTHQNGPPLQYAVDCIDSDQLIPKKNVLPL